MQIVLYCIVFYNNVFCFMLLLEINFILSYLMLYKENLGGDWGVYRASTWLCPVFTNKLKLKIDLLNDIKYSNFSYVGHN